MADLKLAVQDVRLTGLISADGAVRAPADDAALRAGDQLILEGRSEALDRVIASTPLTAARAHAKVVKEEASEEVRAVEAVVQAGSALVGRSAQDLALQARYGVKLLAVRRVRPSIVQKLRAVELAPGDVLVLQGGAKALPEALTALALLPLAERDVRLGGVRRRYSPALILAAAMALVAFNLVPVAIAFFAAAVLMVATGALSMREAYDSLDGQVLVVIGALTPLSEAVRHTGGTDLIAAALAHGLAGAPPFAALVLLMATAMACSPFLHNAPTVLVLGPIAAALAGRLHVAPEAFLMAVATGAGCDFLTPIGHQCNMLVMGPGGYRFSDYARLGAPLSVLVLLIGPPVIAAVWGLGLR